MSILFSSVQWRIVRRKSPALLAMVLSLWLMPAAVQAGGRFVMTTTAVMSVVHDLPVPQSEPEDHSLGIDAPAVDSRELSRQHGRGAIIQAAKGANPNRLAVILWDERGGKGGQTTRVTLTGVNNVQSNTLRLNAK